MSPKWMKKDDRNKERYIFVYMYGWELWWTSYQNQSNIYLKYLHNMKMGIYGQSTIYGDGKNENKNNNNE